MPLTLLSTNYQELPLADLEVLDQHADQIREAILANTVLAPAGAVVLSTCNRFEIYLDADFDNETPIAKPVLDAISQSTGLSRDYLGQVFKISNDQLAIQHLFSVASGLESMVVGEEEIAGQVKRAFAAAQSHGQTSTALIRAFEKAASVAKQVTTTTGLGAAGRSIITVALDYLVSRHGDLGTKKVLLVGTGAHARVVVAALNRLGLKDISVFSSSNRQDDFARSRGLKAVAPPDFEIAVAKAELIITCSGTRANLISTALLQTNLNQPVLVVDLALHADVSPEVASLEKVDFVNLDIIRRHAPAEHGEAVLLAQKIVAESVIQFDQEQLERNLDPFVVAIRRKIALWIDEEVDRIALRVDSDAAAQTRRHLESLAKSMLHEPITRAKALAATGDEDNYRKALLVLFGDHHE